MIFKKPTSVSLHHFLRPVAVEGAVTRPLPARIPACGIIAPGSSDTLASALPTAIAFSEVGTDNRPFMSGQCFLSRLRVPVSPFPL